MHPGVMVPAEQAEEAARVLRERAGPQEPLPPHLGGYRDMYAPGRPEWPRLQWRPIHTGMAALAILLVLCVAINP